MNAYTTKWVIIVFNTNRIPAGLKKIGFFSLGNGVGAMLEVQYNNLKKDAVKIELSKLKKFKSYSSVLITDKQFGLIGSKTKLSSNIKISCDLGDILITQKQAQTPVI